MQTIIIHRDIMAMLDHEGNFLNREDIRIFPAVSNEEALNIHRAENAGVIIAKLDERALSGEQLCSAIRESSELCRVSLIIVHSGDTPDVQRIAGCRANAFIEQSADPALFLDKTEQLLNIPVREAYRTPMGIRVNSEGRQDTSMGYTENISVTGMLFDAERTVSKGELLSCWFVLPDSTHVRTDAEIVRVNVRASEHDPNQYGVRFIDIDPAFRAAIAAYVRKKQQRP